jgi:hypothetical protein
MGELIGKLQGEEIREQRSEKKGVRGGGQIYFGCGGLTLPAAALFANGGNWGRSQELDPENYFGCGCAGAAG